MQILKDESIGDFVARLESEAQERITLAASIRKLMLVENVKTPTSRGNSKEPRPLSVTTRRAEPTLADHIAEVLDAADEPLTQPQIRNDLLARGYATHLKNPASAISTAISRKEGVLFERGNGFEWKLIGKDYERAMPLIDATEMTPAG